MIGQKMTGWVALWLMWVVPALAGDNFKIKVVDAETGRGVPMVELRTLHDVRYFTDSNGYIAFYEPGLMGETVYFRIIGQGYEYPADALGYRGVALRPVGGDSTVIKLQRTIIAERLYRVTGAGIYRDSHLLGIPAPLKRPLLNGRVLGQDSNLSLVFRDKIFWIWGDTFRPDYPLGNFSVSAATSLLPQNGGLDPDVGVDLEYFVDESGFSRKMIDIPGKGFVWFDWVLTLPGENGGEQLVAKYARVRPDFTNYERGLARFNEQTEMFEPFRQVDAWLPDYHSTVHPVLVDVNGKPYYYFTSEFYFQRATPDLPTLATPALYESFTCLQPGARFDAADPAIERDANGRPVWGWKIDTDPIDRKRQQTLLDSGAIRPEQAWLHLRDFATGEPVPVNRGSIYWNEYRRRWVMIAGANVGEIWYGEADTPLGPWVYLRKVADHEQLLYNPVHHPFFDKDGGRVIYFEGTYANTFLPEQPPAPRYQYNQLMYRLHLDDPRLFLPAVLYEIEKTAGRRMYRFWDGVHADSLQPHLRKAAFMAFPPDRALPGLMPVYALTRGNSDFFSDLGAGRPLFYALPPNPDSLELFIGKWQCTATDQVFFTRHFELILRAENGQLQAEIADPGLTLSEFRTSGDSLVLTLQYFDETYSLRGQVQRGKITGQWQANNPERRGIWQARINDPLRLPYHQAALRPLYHYVSSDGTRQFYSPSEKEDAPGFQRQRMPVCRVWQFPGAQLILDAEALPGQ